MDEITINNFSCMIHFYNMKQMDATLPWVCKVIDHRRHQNVVENQWNTWLCLVSHFFCSYFILIYYWTDAKQHENLFVIYLLSYVSNCTIISLISLFLSWSSGSRKFCLTVLSSASFISARFEKASPASWRAWPVGKC